MLTTILALALTFWPFGHPQRPGQHHTLRCCARHLAHVQASRARQLARRHAAHTSLIHF